MLDNFAGSQLRGLGVDVDEGVVAEDFISPTRSLGFSFDVVEICGGSGVLSEALAKEGCLVCPPIDLSKSQHCDRRDLKLVDGIFSMIAEKRFKAVLVEPVCTTFSPAQHPASRAYNQPLGFNRLDPKTWLGNLIAFRCLAIAWFAFRHDLIALVEKPPLSKMACLSIWRFLLKLEFQEAAPTGKPSGSLAMDCPWVRLARSAEVDISTSGSKASTQGRALSITLDLLLF